MNICINCTILESKIQELQETVAFNDITIEQQEKTLKFYQETIEQREKEINRLIHDLANAKQVIQSIKDLRDKGKL